MKYEMILSAVCLTACCSSFGQGKDAFLQQQAYAEMQRVSGQVDVLQSNLNDLQRRVGALEGGGDSKGIRQEIESLKASVADLRTAMRNQRDEIVRDLSARLAKMQAAAPAPAPAPAPTPTKVVIGPHQEYTVQAGDTLSLISQAFGTTVAKIKEMNGLKNDNLRIGQKLKLPK